MNIGKAIRLCRTNKNLTQKTLAEKCEISVPYLSLIENGERDPNYSLLERFSKELSIPLSLIIFLATDSDEISSINKELSEKLSHLTLRLMSEET